MIQISRLWEHGGVDAAAEQEQKETAVDRMLYIETLGAGEVCQINGASFAGAE